MNALSAYWETLDGTGFHAVRILLSVLWQSSILLVSVGLIAWVLRRRRASVRRALWVAAVLVAPALPLLGWAASSIGAPQAAIPLVPSYPMDPFELELPGGDGSGAHETPALRRRILGDALHRLRSSSLI